MCVDCSSGRMFSEYHSDRDLLLVLSEVGVSKDVRTQKLLSPLSPLTGHAAVQQVVATECHLVLLYLIPSACFPVPILPQLLSTDLLTPPPLPP